MTTKPDWNTDGADWPHRAHSRFITAGGLRWHVQVMGDGPAALLLHGTGAASHSWAPLADQLAARFRLVIPDLPGHGFTETPPPAGLSLPGMAAAVQALTVALALPPALVVGHSAGAAVMLRLALDGAVAPRALVGISPALWLPDDPKRHPRSPVLARLVASAPVASLAAGWFRSTARTERFFRHYKAGVPAKLVPWYERLLRNPGHVQAVLTMMGNWDVPPLVRELGRLQIPALFLTGDRDPWFPPVDVARAANRLPRAEAAVVAGAAHVAHEERPGDAARLILAFAERSGVFA
jgi:magnesium chelatase accessory protein